VPTGAAFVEGVEEIEEMFACQSVAGKVATEYQRGSLHGFAVSQRDQFGNFVSCYAVDEGQPESTISCGADNIPRCIGGFRRLTLGLSGPTLSDSEHYFSCEAMD
jgi:hypothetical protein